MKSYFVSISVIIGFMAACASVQQHSGAPLPEYEQSKLQTFEELERSILKITCSAFYENFYYDPPSDFKDPTIPQQSLLAIKKYTTNSVAGTGLLLSQSANRILVLTCYHLFDFADTLKSYYVDQDKKTTRFLQSLAKKFGQTIYVTHKNGAISQGTILSKDENNDLALIETEGIPNTLSELPFQGSFRRKANVKLGQEVYLMGFPKGYLMVTRGLTSPTKYKEKFLIDALFNRGFSGGIIVAFDDQTGEYYYAGMANATAYDSEMTLGPSDSVQNLDNYRFAPYKDEVYLKELKLINYGVTFGISSNTIINFLDKERERLRQMGYANISKLIR